MGMYDAIKDGINLVQASDNMDLLKTFMEIQSGYMEVIKELEEKKVRIRELEEQLQNKSKLSLSDKGYYEMQGNSAKYCSRCYEVEGKLVSLHIHDNNTGIISYICPQCKEMVLKEDNTVDITNEMNSIFYDESPY